jgi:RluA family pseudouridine synthase
MEHTILQRLAALYPQASKTTLREMLESKRVRIDGVIVRSAKTQVPSDAAVEVLDTPAPDETTLAQGLKLLHFDADIIIVEKPAGLLTSTDAQERRPTAWRILSEYFRRQNHKNRVHLIHRLDRDASGLLVFARTREAYAALKSQFFEHTITRQYEVLIHGTPRKPKARLEHLLAENDQGIVHITPDAKKGKLAILDYELLEKNKARRISRLRCTLFTGRKHQIRVQLKATGHAVCGDPVYGKSGEPPGRLALHAIKLAFKHPRTGKPIHFESAAPGSFAHLFRT